MADATLHIDESQVEKIRRIVGKLGLYAAAERLGVDRTTLNIILSGRQPRSATIAILKTSLPKVRA